MEHECSTSRRLALAEASMLTFMSGRQPWASSISQNVCGASACSNSPPGSSVCIICAIHTLVTKENSRILSPVLGWCSACMRRVGWNTHEQT